MDEYVIFKHIFIFTLHLMKKEKGGELSLRVHLQNYKKTIIRRESYYE